MIWNVENVLCTLRSCFVWWCRTLLKCPILAIEMGSSPRFNYLFKNHQFICLSINFDQSMKIKGVWPSTVIPAHAITEGAPSHQVIDLVSPDPPFDQYMYFACWWLARWWKSFHLWTRWSHCEPAYQFFALFFTTHLSLFIYKLDFPSLIEL